jgi:hypothetical protein
VGASVLWQTRPLETAESGTWLSTFQRCWHEISNTGILTLVRCDETFAISKKGLLRSATFKFSRAQREELKGSEREFDVKQLAKGMDNTTIR